MTFKSSIITSELIDQVLHLLDTETIFKKNLISYEIQDNFELLLITVKIDDFSENESASTFKNAGIILNKIIPNRNNDYSWMIVFTRTGKVVDSYFGGNLQFPDSGL